MCEAMDNSSSWVSDTVELRLLSECTTHNIQCIHVLLVCLYCYTAQLNVSESLLTVNSNVSSVQLSCDMAGYTPPTSDLQWFRNGSMLHNSSDYTILYRNGNQNASAQCLSGRFKCSISAGDHRPTSTGYRRISVCDSEPQHIRHSAADSTS